MTSATASSPATTDGPGGGAPPERVTHAHARDIALPDGAGILALVTLDNDLDAAVPTSFGPIGLRELRSVLLTLQRRAADGEIVAVGVTGKPRFLAAGADLTAAARMTDAAQARELGEVGHAAFRLLGELAVPTFAYINGVALGGGFEIALNCTYRTVSGDVAAVGLPETFLGLVPGWGGCYLLPQLVGVRRAVELIINRPLAGNRMTNAAGLLELGCADALFHPADFLEQSIVWTAEVLAGRVRVVRGELESASEWDAVVVATREMLDQRLHGSRPAPYRALDLIAAARTAERDTAFVAEEEALTDLIMSDGLRASLYAFDLTTRKARKPAGAPSEDLARPVRTVGIVGAGLMAGQLAVLLAQRLKVPVVMREIDDDRVAAGLEGVRRIIAGLAKRGLSADEATRLTESITISTDLRTLAGADLVIEAVTEVLELKQQVFAELEDVIADDAILATNTSALSVTAMAAPLRHPERVVGLHFFNPVASMPLVEIVRTPTSSEEAVATAFALVKKLRKTAVGVADDPGFVVNRLLLRMLAEVVATVENGTPVTVADAALRPMGIPMSPFALIQLVGPQVALHVLELLHGQLGSRYPLSPGLTRLLNDGRRVAGAPDGHGAELSVDPAIQDAFGAPGGLSARHEAGVLDAVLAGLTEEIGLMLDEGVVGSPDQIDLCMILGAGWPLHLGGIAPYLDRTGYSMRILGRRLHPVGVANLPR
ncbi:MAG: 3-hydroxyacyl-CoA dehydrogenase NAD-binding domain-containing protein [Cellulomonas sp.]